MEEMMKRISRRGCDELGRFRDAGDVDRPISFPSHTRSLFTYTLSPLYSAFSLITNVTHLTYKGPEECDRKTFVGGLHAEGRPKSS